MAVVPQMELLHKLEVAVLKITAPDYRWEVFLTTCDGLFLAPAARDFRDFALRRSKRAGKTTRPKAKGGLGARMGFRAQASGEGDGQVPDGDAGHGVQGEDFVEEHRYAALVAVGEDICIFEIERDGDVGIVGAGEVGGRRRPLASASPGRSRPPKAAPSRDHRSGRSLPEPRGRW